MERNDVEKLIHEIDYEIIKRLSHRRHDDFRAELDDIFSLYLELLRKYQIQNVLGEEYTLNEIPVYIRRVKKWCKDIEEMVDGYFEGDLLKTIKIYKRLFQRTSRNYPLQFPDAKVKQYSVWYRGRKNEKKEQRNKKELFHVSFGKRGKIGSQRFSILGFPCLYLASSLECCINELNSDTPISICAFTSLSDIDVFDLSFYPSINNKKMLWSYLYLYPMKIACSIPAPKGSEEIKFIPEYIVPEYVLHGTIKQARYSSKSLGFIYTSTSVFSEGVTKEEVRKSTNLVIPAINIKDKGYCDKLRDMFSMTDPVTLHYTGKKNDNILEDQAKILNNMKFGKLPDTEEYKE